MPSDTNRNGRKNVWPQTGDSYLYWAKIIGATALIAGLVGTQYTREQRQESSVEALAARVETTENRIEGLIAAIDKVYDVVVVTREDIAEIKGELKSRN